MRVGQGKLQDVVLVRDSWLVRSVVEELRMLASSIEAARLVVVLWARSMNSDSMVAEERWRLNLKVWMMIVCANVLAAAVS